MHDVGSKGYGDNWRQEKVQIGMKPDCVSMIVPCYNVEAYVGRFIESIVEQTYRNLEIIFVNDGANAATTEMLRAGQRELLSAGFQVVLIEQPNAGLAAAIDAGLKRFTGEFLIWPDPDDWFYPHSVQRLVELMRQDSTIGTVRANAIHYLDEHGRFDGYHMPRDEGDTRPIGLMEDLIFMRTFFGAGSTMVRSEMFLAVHSDRSIYHARASSQNFQLLVPFVEMYPVLQVSEPLLVYRVRADSRSRAAGSLAEKRMARIDQLLDLTDHTLPKLKTYSTERHARVRNFHWRNRMLPTAFRAAMRERCIETVKLCALSKHRKLVARSLVELRCAHLFKLVDSSSGKVASRVLARLFDRVVRLPRAQATWGALPAWASR